MKNTFLVVIASLIFVFQSMAQSCLPNGIEMTTQAQIDNFSIDYPGCTTIGGFFRVEGSDITNLNGLSNVTTFGSHLDMGITLQTVCTTGLAAGLYFLQVLSEGRVVALEKFVKY